MTTMWEMDVHLFSFVKGKVRRDHIITLGEDEHFFLTLERPQEFDEQDKALGWDTSCLVLPDEEVIYGGIQSCVLSASRLTLTLNAQASAELGVTGFDFVLHLSPADRQALAGALSTLFDVPKDRPQLVLDP